MNNFNDLPLARKAELVLRHATRIASVCNGPVTTSLYALDRLFHYQYAELTLGKSCEIMDIRIIGGDDVDKYLTRIEIAKMLKRVVL